MNEHSAALGDPGFLRAMLNVVIPPSGRMPGAGDLDLWPVIAPRLSQNPAGFAALTAGLDAVREAALARDPGGLAAIAPSAAAEIVRSVTGESPALMSTLAIATFMAYYQQPAVLTAIGEPARPPFPEGFVLEPISPEWLSKLRQRAQPGRPATA